MRARRWSESLTSANIKQEAAYLTGKGRASFERPYGLAWLLQLGAELREWDDPQAREMSANLRPLENVAVERLSSWLPKLSHPVRIGEHDQTAFALGLMLDYARVTATMPLPNWRPSGAEVFSGPTRIARSPTNRRAKIFFRPAWARRM